MNTKQRYGLILSGLSAGLNQVIRRQGKETVTRAGLAWALMLLFGCASLRAQTPDAFNPGADNNVSSIAVQQDGKILLGGDYLFLGGKTHNRIGRVNADGTLDTNYNPSALRYSYYAATVFSIIAQTDGKSVLSGWFTNLCGQSQYRLGRLDENGVPDKFPEVWGGGAYPGAYCLAVQPDGKILVGGDFTKAAGVARTNLVRINTDGTLDSMFNVQANDVVYSLAVQTNGQILVGGAFTNLCGQARDRLGRLNPDGTLDTSFTASANDVVITMAVQADGKILMGGAFTNLCGQARSNIGRLNIDGTVDSSFNPGASSTVRTLALQTDGKILVGGEFLTLGGQSRKYIGRLNSAGTVDTNFNTFASNSVYAITLQQDGKVLVGGAFTNLCGQARNYVGRLGNTAAAINSMSFNSTSITWLRSGTSPELSWATFEFSTDNPQVVYSFPGTRISNGWAVTGLNLPTNTTIRVRGPFTGGRYSGSVSFAEISTGTPAVAPPSDRTNLPATTAVFPVSPIGTGPFTYQWLKDGIALTNGGKIFGAQTAVLTVSNVFGAEMGGYSVVVTNALGSVTSAVARLTVCDPMISTNPVSAVGDRGTAVSLTAAAFGTGPFAFQWRKEGVDLPGATGTTLVLTNLQMNDQAGYDVVVSNVFGCATSTVASVYLNLAEVADFNPGVGGTVSYQAIQSDGKIIVAGSFTNLAGLACTNIGRLNIDGSLDFDFKPMVNGGVNTVALQDDGKILIGGDFTLLGLEVRNRIARLNCDGSTDVTFSPDANGTVNALALQTDGKVLAGGSFISMCGQSRSYIARLNGDGSLDEDFNPAASGSIYAIAVQPNGGIVLGGSFLTLNGVSRKYLARLDAAGQLDPIFDPQPSWTVRCILAQANGDITIGGDFTQLCGETCVRIGRVRFDGTPDLFFNRQSGASSKVLCLALQANGKILTGGSFSTFRGETRNGLARLLADGRLDHSFVPRCSGPINSISLQSGGGVLVGGSFAALNDVPRNNLALLANPDTGVSQLSVGADGIRWQRDGACAQVWRTRFDVSNDGVNWAPLGTGTQVPGDGWELSGVSVPRDAVLRVRGYIAGGRGEWFVEDTLGLPFILGYDRPVGFQNNEFGFDLRTVGLSGQGIVVESSSDLISWTPVQTNALGASLSQFSDPESSNSPARFYRLRLQ